MRWGRTRARFDEGGVRLCFSALEALRERKIGDVRLFQNEPRTLGGGGENEWSAAADHDRVLMVNG